MKKIITLILTVILLLGTISFSGCENDDGKMSGEYIVKDGKTNYTIVIPSNPSQQLEFAASEFKNFVKESTGVNIPVLTDDNVSVDDGKKYISIGETKLLSENKISVPDNLGEDGFSVKTVDKNVYLCGGADTGTSYAVYGYLKKLIDLEIYSPDCWTLNHTGKLELRYYNFIDIPDIPTRVLGHYLTWYTSIENMTRMRVVNAESRMSHLGHSIYAFMPTASYYSAHPDWYSSSASQGGVADWQLCLTSEGAKIQLTQNVINYIISHPDIDIISLAHNDGDGHCTCSNCRAKYNQYGAWSGVYIDFCNDVIERVLGYVESELPERYDDLKFLMFAYTFTMDAPIKNGNPTIKCHDKLGVMIAPVGDHVSLPYTDVTQTNGLSYQAFRDWPKVTNTFYIWSYSTHYGDFMEPMNPYKSLKENVEWYVNHGVEVAFDESTHSDKYPNFYALKTYLYSKMYWDSSLDVDTLIKNFINAYYGQYGGKYIQKYFDKMLNKLIENQNNMSLSNWERYSYVAGQLPTNVKDYIWKKDFLLECYEFFQDAIYYNKEHSDDVNYETYEKRIKFESLDVLYLLINLHGDTYPESELKSLQKKYETIATENKMAGYYS